MKDNTTTPIKQRILSFVMVLLMACQFVPVTALASNDWQNLQLSVSWTDGTNTQSRQATAIAWSSNQAFWVQIDGSVPAEGLMLSAYHPNHEGYAYDVGNGVGNLQLTGVTDAGSSLDTNVAKLITAYDGNNQADQYVLYISTSSVPQEPAPTPATITIRYLDENDNEIAQAETRQVTSADTSVTADLSRINSDYTLIDSDTQAIQVTNEGVASPSTFTFRFQKVVVEPVPATITIRYLDENDNEIAQAETWQVTSADTSVTADLNRISSDYTLTDSDTQPIQVTNEGTATPDTFIFRFQKVVVEPVPVTITIRYLDENDNEIAQAETRQVTSADTSVTADLNRIGSDYTLIDSDTQTIQVTNEGVASPSTFTFRFQKVTVEPVPATITIRYLDEQNNEVATETRQITSAVTAVDADLSKVGSNYTIVGDSSQAVQVTNEGASTPSSFTFTVKKNETAPTSPVKVPVSYTKDGSSFYTTTADIPVGGSQPVNVDPNQTPAGYQLEGASSVTVTVDAQGVATPSSVTFNYVVIPAVQKTIKIYYQNESGQNVATAQEKKYGPGTYQVLPEPTDLQANYSIKGDDVKTVTVNQDGTSSVDSVTFVYQYSAPAQETPIPVGSPIDRWGVSNKDVNFRSSPAISDSNKLGSVPNGTHVWMYESQTNNANEVWTRVRVNGQDGYIMADYLAVLSQRDSDSYQASLATPMPTRTPGASTATPTTAAVTPTPTTVPAQYTGYALTTTQVALRIEISTSDASILKALPAQTLVSVLGQAYQNGQGWSSVTTLDQVAGYLPEDSLRRITAEEAKYYIDQYNNAKVTATPTVTVSPTPSPSPVQQTGYAITIGDNVPMRGMADPNSMLVNMLVKNIVVYVSGQEYLNGQAWHIVQYTSQWGYIRADQLRMLTRQETEAYLGSLVTPTPTPAATLAPLDENSPSSYGYVTSSGVNFRQGPSTTAKKIGTLNKYAFALVLSKTVVDGKTWYKVNQAGKEGYILGDYFKVLSIAELGNFLQSPEYVQGATGSTSTSNSNNNSSSNTNNTPSSLEDYNVGVWTNPNSGINATFEPFDPYATPEPLPTSSPTAEPTVSLEPLGTVPPLTYPTEETQTSNPPYLLLGLGGLLLAGAGGLYAFSLHRANQRKAAARAAQRRAASQQQGTQTSASGRPYARTTNAPMVPPVAGTQNRQTTPPGAPRQAAGGPASSAQSPYARPAQMPGQMPNPQQRPGTPAPRPGQPGMTPPTGQVPTRTPSSGATTPSWPSQSTVGSQQPISTARQPRAARHTAAPGEDQGTDTNESL